MPLSCLTASLSLLMKSLYGSSGSCKILAREVVAEPLWRRYFQALSPAFCVCTNTPGEKTGLCFIAVIRPATKELNLSKSPRGFTFFIAEHNLSALFKKKNQFSIEHNLHQLMLLYQRLPIIGQMPSVTETFQKGQCKGGLGPILEITIFKS